MRPESAVGERLLILTLALESALQAENWVESSQLFAERSEAIRRAEETGAKIPAALSDKIMSAESRIMRLLHDRRSSVARGIANQARERSANRSYKPKSHPVCFEGAI